MVLIDKYSFLPRFTSFIKSTYIIRVGMDRSWVFLFSLEGVCLLPNNLYLIDSLAPSKNPGSAMNSNCMCNLCIDPGRLCLKHHLLILFYSFTSGNRTPGSRFYSDLLDTLTDFVCTHQLMLKRRSKR